MTDDYAWDREQARWNAIRAYKKLQKEKPSHPLLKFAIVTKRGRIFKREKIEIVPGHEKEYLDRYAPEPGTRYPLVMDSYVSDLEKAI